MKGAPRLPQKAKGERPQYFADPAVDRLLSIALALSGEVVVLRERLDALERLLERGDPVTREALDRFAPDAGAIAERDAWRERFLELVLGSVAQEQEVYARAAAESPYEAAIRLVEQPAAEPPGGAAPDHANNEKEQEP